MDKLVLLIFICIVYLCVAGHVQYTSNGSAISGSKELEEHSDNAPSCGRIRSSAELKVRKRKISGERYSKYIEFPWMIALFASINSLQCALSNTFCWYGICGGLLIGPKVVLVAGNCAYDHIPYTLKVRAGDWNVDTSEEKHPYQERFVTKIIIHPEYRYEMEDMWFKYDAALLVVQRPFTTADNVAFICLPPPNLNVTLPSCKVAVWTERSVQRIMETGYQAVLKVVELNFLDHMLCWRHLWDDYKNGLVLNDSYICTDGKLDKGNSWPQANGSSPLMCIVEDHYYARGLLSWTIRSTLLPTNHGLASTMHLFTNVVKVRSWIDQEMRANGFTTDTYTPVAYRERTATN